MGFSVFYSWQADAPDRCNRKFIRDALEAAVGEITQEASVIDSPRVESGMEGVAGTPEVASMMFKKIDACDLFLADVTMVGRIDPIQPEKETKLIPNANVSTEMGYAAARLGWERVICVMNEHYGSRFELPFDVRNRRFPIDYTLNPETMEDQAKSKKDLTKWIKKAIETAVLAEHEGVNDALRRLEVNCLIVCSFYQNAPYFRDLGHDTTIREALAHVLDVPGFRSAILRMLDLDLLTTDVQEPYYAYHWTHRGKLLLQELRKRKQLQDVPCAVSPKAGG
jgi:hypothetical protein